MAGGRRERAFSFFFLQLVYYASMSLFFSLVSVWSVWSGGILLHALCPLVLGSSKVQLFSLSLLFERGRKKIMISVCAVWAYEEVRERKSQMGLLYA